MTGDARHAQIDGSESHPFVEFCRGATILQCSRFGSKRKARRIERQILHEKHAQLERHRLQEKGVGRGEDQSGRTLKLNITEAFGGFKSTVPFTAVEKLFQMEETSVAVEITDR